ncbi:predicted protein [Plenodomus lingam JN3]|uniref:Predicted protein n=1 Tax=Leptosphaeria maculans (strain JN3 / isolate v23.1.3 / race Av1-4-5-6-7-8) TaxID=985895 RepID=E4ZLK0_LEPMJ|nr:predicted protein [Plenodomus lingam JN3]CBX92680.1 predicted protein [Plenodomus lingam JN3]
MVKRFARNPQISWMAQGVDKAAGSLRVGNLGSGRQSQLDARNILGLDSEDRFRQLSPPIGVGG